MGHISDKALTGKRYIINTQWLSAPATLAHTIPAREVPDPSMLARFFPPPMPRSYLEPARYRRNIFLLDAGGYVIFADNDATRNYIKEAHHEES